MIEIKKADGCDECGDAKVELYAAIIGRKKITLCEKCLREFLKMTEEYIDRLDGKAV